MRVLFILLCLTASSAQAALIEYSYQSHALFDSFFGESPVLPAEATQVTATFIIDDDFITDGSYSATLCYEAWSTFCSPDNGMIDWVISDGATSYTQNDPHFYSYVSLNLDGDGEVIDWYFYVEKYESQAATPYGENHLIIGAPTDNRTMYCGQVNPDNSCSSSHAALTFNGGTWLATTIVPIPAAVWLFGSALAGLGWMRRSVS
jgi:hypothetical protein